MLCYHSCYHSVSVWLLFFLMRPTAVTKAFTTMNLQKHHAYQPPAWASSHFSKLPRNGRLKLANLPTPLYQVVASTSPTSSILQRFQDLNVTLLIKRDDMSGGVELGGNKIRKLEFLLADALATEGVGKVVTIGGEQSNHCRATACAARMVGLEPHLILRTRKKASDGEDVFDTTGNLLLDRMVGSSIYTCTPGEYGRVGSNALVERLCSYLDTNDEALRSKAYGIPVGGSNGLGTWGYIEAVEELRHQWQKEDDQQSSKLDHVVFACGSGGTAAGLAIGLALCPELKAPQVHAVGVCDDEDYFYNHVTHIAAEMGLKKDNDEALNFVKDSMTVHQGKGLGYAVATSEELAFCQQFAVETGIALDPVYTGKALYHFVTHVLDDSFRDSSVLFWHTGGALGMYEKGDDLTLTPVNRLDVYGSKKESDDTERVVSI